MQLHMTCTEKEMMRTWRQTAFLESQSKRSKRETRDLQTSASIKYIN